MTLRYHPCLFGIRTIGYSFLLIPIIAIAVFLTRVDVPIPWVVMGAVLVSGYAVVLKTLRAFIDWRYDLIIITSDKVIIVNQSSIFHREIRQMHLENFASVTARTQYLNLFPFGKLCFDLKEGVGRSICLNYVPRADFVASRIAECVQCMERQIMPPY
jgi:hypothetical protein